MSNTRNAFGKYLLLWFGEFVSAIGSGLTSFGLGVYIYQKTGSAAAMSLVTLLAFMPSLLLSAPAGVLADRYDRRLLMVLGDGLSALGLIFIWICMLLGEAQLWQICIGVTISSIFSSLMGPAYKATVTDLLTPEQYTKASGLAQVAGSAKYLFSPILAGFLLTFSDIKLLLFIDICTLFITVIATFVVRSGLEAKEQRQETKSFIREFKDGWRALFENKVVFVLVIISSFMTFFLGIIQTLSKPVVLAFADTSTLGIMEGISASGMLITSILIGFFSIKKNHAKALAASVFFAGLFMVLFGLRENIILICVTGFLFFAMLPVTNTCFDFLIRTSIGNDVQGRAWGLIGIISQMGYVVAYAISGLLADYIFTPLLLPGGLLANSLGRLMGTGTGRGPGLMIVIAGALLCITSLALYRSKRLRELERTRVVINQ